MRTADLRRRDFVWKGLAYHLAKRKTPVLTLVQDDTYPHLYRIRYPNGWVSAPGNLTRAKDAAYGHALHLLTPVTRASAPTTAETPYPVPENSLPMTSGL
jgi:hypothetical protein